MVMQPNTLFDDCVSQIRGQFLPLGIFSFAANLLLLVGAVYMLQVIDRVLSSGSFDTLFWLTAAALLAIAVYGVLELARRRMLTRTGAWLDTELAGPVIRRGLEAQLRGVRSEASLADVQEMRTFLSGDAILAFLDAPWMPVFIGLIWLMHPVLGWLALAGAIALFVVAVVNDVLTRRLLQRSRTALEHNLKSAQLYLDNAETVRALGMLDSLLARWQKRHQGIRQDIEQSSAINSGLSSLSRSLRLALQILILGAGAWLVLIGELTGGGMIAASIILSRALSPVERALGAWRSFISARAAMGNLRNLFQSVGMTEASFQLPEPVGELKIEGLRHHPPRASLPILKKVDLKLLPGETCGIIGPSGAGKSTLCRLIVGAWKPTQGHVRLDGADVMNWDPEDLGRHIGYLPQAVELFPGTISQNIARMHDCDDAAVIEAAKLADVHEMILRLPAGYDTDVGKHGHLLSGGQKQRIGLARAVFGMPALIVLDEPNSNLDNVGEQALRRALVQLKKLGRTILIVAHQPNMLRTADHVLVLKDGLVADFGDRQTVLRNLMQHPEGQRVVAMQKAAKEQGASKSASDMKGSDGGTVRE
jgi:PrtD family type I secretion system ABC transporter